MGGDSFFAFMSRPETVCKIGGGLAQFIGRLKTFSAIQGGAFEPKRSGQGAQEGQQIHREMAPHDADDARHYHLHYYSDHTYYSYYFYILLL